MKIEDILFIDPLNKNYSHVYFNAAIISCLSSCSTLIGSRSHVKKVRGLVSCKCLSVQDSTFSIGIFKTFLILLKKSILRKKQIYFLCIDNTLLPILLFLTYPLLFTNSISIIIHNNLTTLTENRYKRFLHKIVTKLYSATVFVLTKKMEQVYKSNVGNTELCILLPHPNYTFFLKNIDTKEKILYSPKINIVLLGRQTYLLLDFMETLDFSKYPNIHFTIACSEADTRDIFSDEVTIFREKLPFSHYYSVFDQADFCLFASDRTVENRASGIFMDCISLNCPIIAPKKGHFLEYKSYNIGYLYNDYNELSNIFDLINHLEIRRDCFLNGFTNAKAYSSLSKCKNIIFN